MEMYKDTSSRVMVNGQFSELFYITKGRGTTRWHPSTVLKVTGLGNFGVQTHPDKSLHDLDFADDIVLLDSDSERTNEHLTCLQENAGYVELVINLMNTLKLCFLIASQHH